MYVAHDHKSSLDNVFGLTATLNRVRACATRQMFLSSLRDSREQGSVAGAGPAGSNGCRKSGPRWQRVASSTKIRP